MVNKQKTPVTIILFLIWIGFSFLLTLPVFIINKSYIGPFFLEGVSSIVYTLIPLVVYGLIFYGTIRRKIWSRNLTLIYFPLLVLITLVNLITYFINKDLMISFFSQLTETKQAAIIVPIESLMLSSLLSGFISQIIVTTLIVVLMIKKKDYFSN